jgi:hypothetical protein
MNAVNLTVDVHCDINHRALSESSIEYIIDTVGPAANIAYRLYINDIMLIERQWCWGNNNIVRENILVNLPINATNKLYIEPIIKLASTAIFKLSNCTIDVPFTSEQINDLTISFTL